MRSSIPAIPGRVKAVAVRYIHGTLRGVPGRSQKTRREDSLASTSTLRIELASQSPSCFSYFKYKKKGGKEEGRKEDKEEEKGGEEMEGEEEGKEEETMVLGCVVDGQSLSSTLAVDLGMRISTSPI